MFHAARPLTARMGSTAAFTPLANLPDAALMARPATFQPAFAVVELPGSVRRPFWLQEGVDVQVTGVAEHLRHRL